MYLVRRLMLALLFAIIALGIDAFTEPPKNLPDLPAGTNPWLLSIFTGAWTGLNWAANYPLYAITALVLLALPAVLAEVARLLPRRIPRDPVRLFAAGVKSRGASRAGDRCEMETVFFTRCRRPGEHGDHWYPHSKGGASSLENYVHACARHNLAKGGRVPTFWETTRLELRRRRYFQAGDLARPGARF